MRLSHRLAGGMGKAYRARDKRLRREGAPKVLPWDAGRLVRSNVKPRSLRISSHSGIAVLFGFEESDGTRSLAKELVEGPMLAERTRQGTVTLPRGAANRQANS
jgi:hypothetical protein